MREEIPYVDTADVAVQLAAAKLDAHQFDGTVIGDAVRIEIHKALDKYAERLYSKARRQGEEVRANTMEEPRKRQKKQETQVEKAEDHQGKQAPQNQRKQVEEVEAAKEKEGEREQCGQCSAFPGSTCARCGYSNQKQNKEEQVMIWWQSNLTFGGGAQCHTGYLVPWSDVKKTIFGQEFGDKKVCFSSFDVSGGRSRATEEDKKRSDDLDILLAKGFWFYNNENDNREAESYLSKADRFAVDRILVVRSFF